MTTEQGENILRVDGDRFVNGRGEEVRLRGIGLAGWLNMENWMTGFPAHEQGQRDAVRDVLGPERTRFFFDRFLDHFFTEADAAFIASLGLNSVRIPIHYRHLESDARPFEIIEDGFHHLDRAIDLLAAHGIYSIIDLHTLPGWQNQDWHCDNPTHTAQFWQHRHFQDRTLHLWRIIAQRYRHNDWVAGYNALNEPSDPTGQLVGPFSRELVEVIRDVDPNHIIFLDGNRYGNDFEMFDASMPNTVFSAHDYAPPGYMPDGQYPGVTHLTHVWEPVDGKTYAFGVLRRTDSRDQYFDREALHRMFEKRSEFMRRTGTPVWVGEFNAIFTGDPQVDEMRLRLLGDQFEHYEKTNSSWAFWPLKDIGLCGPLSVAPESPWMRRIEPVLRRKAKFGVDLWGGTHDGIRHVMDPLKQLFATEFPDYQPYPFGAEFFVNRLVPQILLAEALLPEFGEVFRGMDETAIDEMMQSFRFENCRSREPLVELIRKTTGADTKDAGEPVATP
ncbi:cellulase family glycosylhydrolase [Plantactinospora sp. S1510]|uniref:Cellulase family glycosylhydrolase n=1 Tax=Plantactinospora alkalitolerans TaxID=2789879 RepID=A0ABS0GTY4_9ACTN|nr:cellulase family glycosylhydrolase [Plantactinospora alkalitolerans]MBF9129658.1 cellulase family glycosylhydrolase [Plantactinospora alkalitolerans]